MFFKQLTNSFGLTNTTTGFTTITSFGTGSSGTSSVIPLTKDNCGQITYFRPGTYTWVCPAGVTAVSVVCIGGGGGGYNGWANAAGSGGGLGWKNNISVSPGGSYTVAVGDGGTKNGNVGAASYFISTSVVAGFGGGNATSGGDTNGPNKNVYGGGWVGDGGGAGGNASYAGGGGAGGYTGNGGGTNSLPAANSGGACGGGYYSSTYGTGAGGGTGINGKGETASGWWHGNLYIGTTNISFSTDAGNGGGGQGGSGGSRGMSGQNPSTSTGEGANTNCMGGLYGGGGGGPGTSWSSNPGIGGWGAVKLIWTTVPVDSNNPGRLFPSTNTADIS
jgi:hypothetical protein